MISKIKNLINSEVNILKTYLNAYGKERFYFFSKTSLIIFLIFFSVFAVLNAVLYSIFSLLGIPTIIFIASVLMSSILLLFMGAYVIALDMFVSYQRLQVDIQNNKSDVDAAKVSLLKGLYVKLNRVEILMTEKESFPYKIDEEIVN